jgi:hypothetical protein
MKRTLKLVLILTYVLIIPFSILESQTLRIMPMGNSITYDENSLDEGQNIRPAGKRISYRYKLYQLLTEAGYSFDFVGSENAGNDYFQNPEMDDNAGFPGIDKAQLAYLLETGYNQRSGAYESPGAYLLSYPADIILLHIGTNNLSASASEIKDILDIIRSYDSDVIVLVARIINRETYSSLTTTFNDNVELMVTALHDPRIIMVNMETGAGMNYSTDMIDNLHPNQNGYNKMAFKWFNAIVDLNNPPIIASIPPQSVFQGSSFDAIYLDDYITDAEDPDNLIQWTFSLQQDSKLSVSIDASRVLHVLVTDNAWYGSETILLKALDTGSGAYQKTDSVEVIFTVQKSNEPPIITSTPNSHIDEDNNYNYTIEAIDNDDDILSYSALQIPSWLSFSSVTHSLSGRPTNSEVGTYDISLRVYDGKDYTDQDYQLTVNNVNDLPIIISVPVTAVQVGQAYMYEFMATDVDAGDVLSFSASYKPDWLSFSSITDKAILFGSPTQANVGANAVILKVSDGHADLIQGFTITVSGATAINDINLEEEVIIYPNPIISTAYFKSSHPVNIKFLLFNTTGLLLKEIVAENTDKLEIDLSGITKGIYFYKAFVNNTIILGTLSKIE